MSFKHGMLLSDFLLNSITNLLIWWYYIKHAISFPFSSSTLLHLFHLKDDYNVIIVNRKVTYRDVAVVDFMTTPQFRSSEAFTQ